MTSVPLEVQTHVAARLPIIVRRMIWITARLKATGAPQSVGFWSGQIQKSFTIDSESRSYYAAGSLLKSDAMVSGAGLEVRYFRVGLAAVNPEVEDLVRQYDLENAQADFHWVVYDKRNGQILGQPFRRFRGFVDKVSFPRGVPDEAPACILDLVTETRYLTRALSLRKSHEAQKRRLISSGVHAGQPDQIRKYGDVSGVVPVYWGELRADPPASAPPSAPRANPVSRARSEGR